MLARPTLREQAALDVAEARERGQAQAQQYWLRLVNEGWGRPSQLQREHQADHHDAIGDGEVRIGRRT